MTEIPFPLNDCSYSVSFVCIWLVFNVFLSFPSFLSLVECIQEPYSFLEKQELSLSFPEDEGEKQLIIPLPLFPSLSLLLLSVKDDDDNDDR